MPMTGTKPRLYKAGWNGSFNQNHLIKVQYPNTVQAAAMQGAIETAAVRQGVKQTIQKGLARDAANDAAFWGWKNKLAGLAGLLGFLCTFECTADDKNIYDKGTYNYYREYRVNGGPIRYIYGDGQAGINKAGEDLLKSHCPPSFPFSLGGYDCFKYKDYPESITNPVRLGNWGPMTPKTIEQPIPDLDDKIDDWMKRNPSPAVNAPNDGKNIPEVEIPKARFLNPRPIISPPYTNPNTGEPEQETYSPSQPKTNPKPNPSPKPGDAKSPDGNSKEKNDPNKGVVPRPDVKPGEGTAPVPKPIAPPRPKPNPDKDKDPETKPETKPEDLCKLHPNILACVDASKLGPEGDQPDVDIPDIEKPMTYSPLNLFSSSGTCPQPRQFSVTILKETKTFDISWQPTCDFVEKMRMIVILCASFIAIRILFGGTSNG